MSFLLNNACWLSEGKGFVDLYILWLFLPPPTTLSKGCFVSWLVCFGFFFVLAFFGWFWFCLFFVELRMSFLLCFLPLLPSGWSPVHSPLLVSLYFQWVRNIFSRAEAHSVEAKRLPFWHESCLLPVPMNTSVRHERKKDT